jgi:hypothetical protein
VSEDMHSWTANGDGRDPLRKNARTNVRVIGR